MEEGEEIEGNAWHRLISASRYIVESEQGIESRIPDPRKQQSVMRKRAEHTNPEHLSDWFTTELDEIFTSFFFGLGLMEIRKKRYREIIDNAIGESMRRWVEVCVAESEIREFVKTDWKDVLDSLHSTARKLEEALGKINHH